MTSKRKLEIYNTAEGINAVLYKRFLDRFFWVPEMHVVGDFGLEGESGVMEIVEEWVDNLELESIKGGDLIKVWSGDLYERVESILT